MRDRDNGLVNIYGESVRRPSHKAPSLVDVCGRPIWKLGYVKNPFLDFPGHLPCFCDGQAHPRGQKTTFKKCCLPRMAAMIPPEDADIGREFMAWFHEQRESRKKVWEVRPETPEE